MTKQLPHRTLADVLRDELKLSGQSIAEAARESGIPQPVLSRFANGLRGLNLETADKLAVHLRLELRTTRRRRKAKPRLANSLRGLNLETANTFTMRVNLKPRTTRRRRKATR